jgi:DNA polymerase zeta
MPLILEPESGFYSSPVLVFDFQSLYPSVMIAYNLCYSTCLGRLQEFMGTNRLGTSSLALAAGTLALLKDEITCE